MSGAVHILNPARAQAFMNGLAGYTPTVAVKQAESRLRFLWGLYRNAMSRLDEREFWRERNFNPTHEVVYRIALREQTAKVRVLRAARDLPA